MKCLHKTCPMGGRVCPATNTCPEFKRAFVYRMPMVDNLQLTPDEAKDLFEKLGHAIEKLHLSHDKDYWPSKKELRGHEEPYPTIKFWMIKPSGQVLKEEALELYAWNREAGKWDEETYDLLYHLIEGDSVVELQHPYRGDEDI